MKLLSFDVGIKNLGFVFMEIDKDLNIINIAPHLVDISKGKKAKSCRIHDLIINMFNELNKYDISDIDKILIENQPSFTNPTCKSLSIALYTYYIMKEKDAQLVSPLRKLGTAGKKLTYNEKKNQSIIECYKILNESQREKINELNRYHDVTDAILQAREWCRHFFVSS